jgi:hypothetical protein
LVSADDILLYWLSLSALGAIAPGFEARVLVVHAVAGQELRELGFLHFREASSKGFQIHNHNNILAYMILLCHGIRISKIKSEQKLKEITSKNKVL